MLLKEMEKRYFRFNLTPLGRAVTILLQMAFNTDFHTFDLLTFEKSKSSVMLYFITNLRRPSPTVSGAAGLKLFFNADKKFLVFLLLYSAGINPRTKNILEHFQKQGRGVLNAWVGLMKILKMSKKYLGNLQVRKIMSFNRELQIFLSAKNL